MSVERMQWVGHHLASTQSPWGDRPVGGGMGAFLPWGKLSQEAPGGSARSGKAPPWRKCGKNTNKSPFPRGPRGW